MGNRKRQYQTGEASNFLTRKQVRTSHHRKEAALILDEKFGYSVRCNFRL